MTRPGARRGSSWPTVGIVTALPHECFAVWELLADVVEADRPDDPGHYYLGCLPSADPDRPHRVVLTVLAEDGGIAAAHACANLRRSWVAVQEVVMCGIGCGVPAPGDPDRHVRLGDVLVAFDGVVPYGHIRRGSSSEQLRRHAAKPSATLKRAAQKVRVDEEGGAHPCQALLSLAGRPRLRDYQRPTPGTDLLYQSDHADAQLLAHPDQPRRRPDLPMVHYGLLGSGGKLLRDAEEVRQLAARYQLIGFDMEGDGVSDGSYLQGVSWFMVRGASDYGSRRKADRWQRYAALAAATYTCTLLARCRPIGRPEDPATPSPAGVAGTRTGRAPVQRTGPVTAWAGEAATAADGPAPVRGGAAVPAQRHPPGTLSFSERSELVDALLAIDDIQDPHRRNAVILELPPPIPAVMTRYSDSRSDTASLVQTVLHYPDGMAGLVRVLRARTYRPGPGRQRLSTEDVASIVDALLRVHNASEPGARQLWVSELEKAFPGLAPNRAADARTDLFHLVRACESRPGAARQLVAVIDALIGSSRSVQELASLVDSLLPTSPGAGNGSTRPPSGTLAANRAVQLVAMRYLEETVDRLFPGRGW
ncbi:MAG TPA: hypothetical protein VFM55_14185 [Micromonosporaceae bacterium]|nr:hypothetical protein [Micromonosporaceae bacterium]